MHQKRAGGGEGVLNPQVGLPKMAQINISFCKFYCLRQGTSKREKKLNFEKKIKYQ